MNILAIRWENKNKEDKLADYALIDLEKNSMEMIDFKKIGNDDDIISFFQEIDKITNNNKDIIIRYRIPATHSNNRPTKRAMKFIQKFNEWIKGKRTDSKYGARSKKDKKLFRKILLKIKMIKKNQDKDNTIELLNIAIPGTYLEKIKFLYRNKMKIKKIKTTEFNDFIRNC